MYMPKVLLLCKYPLLLPRPDSSPPAQVLAICIPMIPVLAAPENAVSLEAVVLIVIFGSNNCFSTPNGYATQIMVMAEGKYVFADYLKFGGAVQVSAV